MTSFVHPLDEDSRINRVPSLFLENKGVKGVRLVDEDERLNVGRFGQRAKGIPREEPRTIVISS